MTWRALILLGLFGILSFGCSASVAMDNPIHTSSAAFGAHFPRAFLVISWVGQADSKDAERKSQNKDCDSAPKTAGEKIWVALNSSFGLWVLSSVVLAWITKAYSNRETRKAETLKKAEAAQRVDTEIAHRLAMAIAGARVDESRVESGSTNPKNIYINYYDYLENYFIQNDTKGRDFSAFPEFRERSFRSLILELRTLVDANTGADLKIALDAFEELAEWGDLGSEDSSREACLEALVKVRELLEKRAVRPRWRTLVDFLATRKGDRPSRTNREGRN
jgi:hypothetical protein